LFLFFPVFLLSSNIYWIFNKTTFDWLLKFIFPATYD
jgi:hypothetical protein